MPEINYSAQSDKNTILITSFWYEILPYLIFALGIWVQLQGYILIGTGIIIIGIFAFRSTVPVGETMNFQPDLIDISKWVQITPTELARLRTKIAKIEAIGTSWDSCLSGCIFIAGLPLSVVVFPILLSGSLEGNILGTILTTAYIDIMLLALAYRFLAIPTTWKPEKIKFKLPIFEQLIKMVKSLGAADWSIEYQLELQKSAKGEVPTDIKLILKPPDCPKEFLGIQVQVAKNRGQPYVYFVIVTRKELTIIEPPNNVEVPNVGLLTQLFVDFGRRDICEPKYEKDVNVLVIRQDATKYEGYITNFYDQKRLLVKSLISAKKTIGLHV